METSDLLLKTFEKQEAFEGTLHANGEVKAKDVRCRITVNPVDPRLLKAELQYDGRHGRLTGLMNGPHLTEVCIRSDPATRNDQLQVSGYVVGQNDVLGQNTRFGGRPDELRLDVREVIHFASEEVDFKDDGPKKVYMKWMLPPLTELGDPFRANKHPERGLVLGWKPDSFSTWEKGQWESQNLSFQLEDISYTVRPALHFEDVETADGKAYVTVPRLHVKSEQVDDSLPWSIDQAAAKLQASDDAIWPLVLALRFAVGKRIGSKHQVQSTYDPQTKIQTRLERFQQAVDKPTQGVQRMPKFQRHWPLITDIAQAVHRQEGEERRRTERAIHRYVTAFEAPFIEMQLVALHSALTFIVSSRDDAAVTPSEDLPAIKGRLLTPLSKFITAKKVEWKDLIPDGHDKSALFEFNNLRNAYLKDLEHTFDDIAPFEIARRLFERVLLAHLELDPSDYSMTSPNKRN